MIRWTAAWRALSRASRAWPPGVLITPTPTTLTTRAPGRSPRPRFPPSGSSIPAIARSTPRDPRSLCLSCTPSCDKDRESFAPATRRRASEEPPFDRRLRRRNHAPWGRSRRGPSRPSPTASRGGDGVDGFVGDVVVGMDRLDVVLLLENLDQPQHRCRILALHPDRGLRHHVDLGLHDRNPLALQRLAHRLHFIRSRGDLEQFLDLPDVRGPGLQRLLEQLVLLDAQGVRRDHPPPLEHPGHAPGRAHVPAVLLEEVADLGPGTVLVVREHAQEHGHAGRTVLLVGDLLVLLTGQLA